jgi:flagellar hook-length control protein FliK
LLVGKLVPAVLADVLPEIAAQKDSSETDPTASDAAALLAALGMVVPEAPRTSDTAVPVDAAALLPTGGKIDKVLSDTLPALNAGASPDAVAKLAAKSDGVAGQPLSIIATADEPAKFAVAAPLAPAVEAAVVKTLAHDTPLNNQALPAIGTHNVAPSHEVALSLPTPLRDQNWAGDFAQKVVWMATADKQVAQLTLNPPQMGPIQISLSLDKANATASFVSANADVRDAIESALPRLREMFASAGIQLGHTNVSAESFKQQSGNGEGYRPTSHWTADNAILGADSGGSLRSGGFAVRQGNGMVDIFA